MGNVWRTVYPSKTKRKMRGKRYGGKLHTGGRSGAGGEEKGGGEKASSSERGERRKERAFLLVMSRGYRGLAWIAPMLTRPYRSPGEGELSTRRNYSLNLFIPSWPRRKLAEKTPSRRRGTEPVEMHRTYIRNWYPDSVGGWHEYTQRLLVTYT